MHLYFPRLAGLDKELLCFFFIETWLNNNIPDSAIQLHGLTCCGADRDSSLSGKTHGGGLCVYINKEWCNNAAVLSKHCSSLVEFTVVKCRPFYLPREFTAIVIVSVYIPPCANTKDALHELYSAISEQQTNNSDGFFIIASDFNHANHFSNLPNLFKSRSRYGQTMLPQHCRTASTTQTGTCLKRRLPTTTTQTCMSTLKLWLLTSKSALMIWQSPRPSPRANQKDGWQQKFVGC